jgi:Flp pilus assembly protein TadD
MSRFSNLEFDEASRHEEDNRPVLRDEASYLAEAQALFEAGRFEQGLRAYAKVLEFNSRNSTAWGGQVRMLIELGEYREAKLWADKGLEACPNEPELLAAKAVALGRSGDLAAAIAFSDAAIEERGNTPYVWLARADVLLARKEAKADYCFEKALGLASFHWFYLWLASRIQAFHRQTVKALQLAQRALETAAHRAVIWLQLGDCQMALGLAAAARNAYEQARQLDPALVSVDLLEGARPGGLGWKLRGWWRRWTGG